METLRVSIPALLTVSPEIGFPRHVSLGDLEKAFSMGEISRWGLNELGLRPEEVGLQGSATRVWKLHKPLPKGKGKVHKGSSQELAVHFLKKLEALSILDEEEPNE